MSITQQLGADDPSGPGARGTLRFVKVSRVLRTGGGIVEYADQFMMAASVKLRRVRGSNLRPFA